MDNVDQLLARLAAPHAGAFRLGDAYALGIPRWAIRTREQRGSAFRRHPRVLILGCDLRLPDTECWAALLAAEPDAHLMRESAAYEWGLSRATHCPPPEIVVVRRHRPLEGVTLLQSRTMVADDRTIRNGRPVTSVERTLVDLADVRSVGAMGRYLRQAAYRGVLNVDRVRHAIARNPNRRGTRRMNIALDRFDHGDQGADNREEARFLPMLHANGVTDALANKEFVIQGAIVRPDVYIPSARMAVELDEGSHGIPVVTREDALKGALLRSAGIDVVRIDQDDLQAGLGIVLVELATRQVPTEPRAAKLGAT